MAHVTEGYVVLRGCENINLQTKDTVFPVMDAFTGACHQEAYVDAEVAVRDSSRNTSETPTVFGEVHEKCMLLGKRYGGNKSQYPSHTINERIAFCFFLELQR